MLVHLDLQMARRIDAVDFSLRQEQQRTMQALQAVMGQAPDASSARAPASVASTADSRVNVSAAKSIEAASQE